VYVADTAILLFSAAVCISFISKSSLDCCLAQFNLLCQNTEVYLFIYLFVVILVLKFFVGSESDS